MTAITRYVTVGLALFESVAMAVGFGRQGLLTTFNAVNVIVVVAALTAGSAFLMWVGEQINDKGVGNGISMVLLINILSRIPQDMVTLYETFVKGKTIARGLLMWIIIAVVIIAVVVLVLILNGAERRIPVQYSKKMAGRKMVGGQSSNIPLKVNTAGVIPIIFASSIMSFPSIILSFVGKSDIKGIGGTLIKMLNSNNWFDKTNPVASLGLILYIVLVVFFAYFYTSITFNPMEVADNMKKQGGFIPGIRPGKSTVDYLNNLLSYIIFIGAAGLTIVAVIPFFFNGFFKANVSFGGTSLIIIASVILETLKQIESMMLVRNYKGFLILIRQLYLTRTFWMKQIPKNPTHSTNLLLWKKARSNSLVTKQPTLTRKPLWKPFVPLQITWQNTNPSLSSLSALQPETSQMNPPSACLRPERMP